MLYNIYNRPKKLYVLGNIENLRRKCIAIVGCRDCSDYGKRMARISAYRLAKKGLVVVSGLAKGIDSYAHIGALQAKGRTIAVLGNSINYIYPKENINLAKSILKNKGTIISEYSINDKIERKNFEMRNRIISGLSEKVIVVEARKKSGALITANYAIEQGRDVYAIPGNISSDTSIGTNMLIKEGAGVFVI